MAGGVKYSREVMDRIYALMAEGMSLAQIGRMDGMPSAKSVQEWIIKYPDREGDLYARARDLQAEAYAGQIVEIADTEPDAQVARNRIDARKWVASKLAPRRYGDRVEVEHSGQVGQVMQVNVNVVAATPRAPVSLDNRACEPPALDVNPIQAIESDK